MRGRPVQAHVLIGKRCRRVVQRYVSLGGEHEDGYRGVRAKGLKGKHIEALVRDWFRGGLSHGTMMNRMPHVRWWAAKVGKPNIVKPNAEYGIVPRSHVSDGTKRRDLDAEKLARVKDEHVGMALRLQAAFGPRREEAIKFAGVGSAFDFACEAQPQDRRGRRPMSRRRCRSVRTRDY